MKPASEFLFHFSIAMDVFTALEVLTRWLHQ